MKRSFLIFAVLLSFTSAVHAAPKSSEFHSNGEVISVDPMYGRITIKHPAIKGFSGDAETEFFVKSNELLKDISTHDLVDFTIIDEKGDTRIEKIVRTGVAPVKDDSVPLGRAVQGVLVATGEAAKTVTSPIAPAHEVVSGTVGATTDTTENVLHDATPEVKKKF